MMLDPRQLQCYRPGSATQLNGATLAPQPPPDADTVIVGAGNSGESCALLIAACLRSGERSMATLGINSDRLAPRSVPVRSADGMLHELTLDARLVLGAGHARDRLRDEPLLRARYDMLLRGIPVLETYPRSGHGSHGHPAIAMLDIDLGIEEILRALRSLLRTLLDEAAPAAHGSAVARLLHAGKQRNQPQRVKRVLICGGGGGAMGNAAHQVLPYLVRHILAEMGLAPTAYEIWAVVLGPQAFSTLTPFVGHNYRALMEGLDACTRHGQRRRYRNGLAIDSAAPPYDQLFCFDDPQLAAGGAATEAALDAFLARTALSVSLLLRGTVWETIAAHTANPDQPTLEALALDQPRYLASVRATLAGADRAALRDHLAAAIERRLLETLAERLNG
jgi:hypothetical protein